MADFEIITEGKLSSPATEINITSIPATYTHLECVFALRQTGTASSGNAYMQLNGDSGANYGQYAGYVNGNGWSGVTSAAFAARTGSVTYYQSATVMAKGTGPSGIFYVNHIMIPLYSSTTTSTKTIMSTSTIGWNDNNNYMEYGAGFYNTTSAINAIKLVPLGGVNIDTNSSWWIGGYA